MGDAYTVFWRRDDWSRAITVGGPLTALFGGHQMSTRFRRAGVRPGDLLYPIGVHHQIVYVFARMRVARIAAIDDDTQRQQLFAAHRSWSNLAPWDTGEVVVGAAGTPVHLDRPIPYQVLKDLTYVSQRGTRTLRHVGPDGRLTNSLGVQGIYRLAPWSAAHLESVLTGPAGSPPIMRRPLGRTARVTAPPAGMDPLF